MIDDIEEILKICRDCNFCSCCPCCEESFCSYHETHLRNFTLEEIVESKCFKEIEENYFMKKENKIYSSKDVAALYNISIRRVSAIAESRKIGQRVGKNLAFFKDDLEKLKPLPTGGTSRKVEGTEKYCKFCGKRLVRKKYKCNHFEQIGDFEKRNFCNRECKKSLKEKEKVNILEQ